MQIFVKQPINGVIYDASWGQTYGDVVIVTSQGQIFTIEKFLEAKDKLLDSDIGIGVVRGVGAGLVTLGISGAVLTARPVVSAEIEYQMRRASGVISKQTQNLEYEEAVRKSSEAAEQRAYASKFAQEIGITNTDFAIYIPKINAKAPIVANTDPAVPDTYMEALKKGVAHAYGSSLPGRPGAMYVFAHSTNGPWNVSQYNAIFYLLRELEPENKDEIYVFFQGKVHKYRVTEKHITEADDVSWLTDAQTGPERLILQTCWPPGTIWKRLIVVATPEKIETGHAEVLPQGTQDAYGGGI